MVDSQLEAQIPGLRRYARALCAGDAAQADDLVQDCLERALSRWASWRGESELRLWLLAILRNLWLDEVRRRGARPDLVDVDDCPDSLAVAPSQGQALVLRDLAGALGRLAPEQREVLVLVGLEGLSYAQVAQVTGTPMGTVMSRLKRGRDRLAQLMREDGPALRRVK
ncbi:MAG: sigma-70 family RNA polymerase sigma factor [Magnetospirillum gryphiswaldense]|nr:sigma-70 family RNA polymerase sigma factor [Magnetospirillum gryphiswaldense]